MTPSGIERATFRFLAQHLNHCATGVLSVQYVTVLNTVGSCNTMVRIIIYIIYILYILCVIYYYIT